MSFFDKHKMAMEISMSFFGKHKMTMKISMSFFGKHKMAMEISMAIFLQTQIPRAMFTNVVAGDGEGGIEIDHGHCCVLCYIFLRLGTS